MRLIMDVPLPRAASKPLISCRYSEMIMQIKECQSLSPSKTGLKMRVTFTTKVRMYCCSSKEEIGYWHLMEARS